MSRPIGKDFLNEVKELGNLKDCDESMLVDGVKAFSDVEF